MYTTGDLGRIDADGNLVFLGRLDDQVKIRGHRLEPAWVERTLCENPAVDQAVVFPDPRTGTALWAFTVPADPRLAPLPGEAVRLTGAERDALVEQLTAHLPDWAVPRVLYRVSVLPKNPHGKVDKRRLTDGGPGRPGAAGGSGRWRQPGRDALAADLRRPGGRPDRRHVRPPSRTIHGEKANATAFVVRRFIDRSLLVDLSANPR